MTKVFVEQPLARPGSSNYYHLFLFILSSQFLLIFQTHFDCLTVQLQAVYITYSTNEEEQKLCNHKASLQQWMQISGKDCFLTV